MQNIAFYSLHPNIQQKCIGKSNSNMVSHFKCSLVKSQYTEVKYRYKIIFSSNIKNSCVKFQFHNCQTQKSHFYVNCLHFIPLFIFIQSSHIKPLYTKPFLTFYHNRRICLFMRLVNTPRLHFFTLKFQLPASLLQIYINPFVVQGSFVLIDLRKFKRFTPIIRANHIKVFLYLHLSSRRN